MHNDINLRLNKLNLGFKAELEFGRPTLAPIICGVVTLSLFVALTLLTLTLALSVSLTLTHAHHICSRALSIPGSGCSSCYYQSYRGRQMFQALEALGLFPLLNGDPPSTRRDSILISHFGGLQ